MRVEFERVQARPAPRARALAGLLVVLPLLTVGCGSDEKKPGNPKANALVHDTSTARATSDSMRIDDVYIPPPPAGVYRVGSGLVVNVTLANEGSAWDSVVSGSSPVARRVAFGDYDVGQEFLSVPNDDQPVSGLIRLSGLARPLAPGQQVPITLQFASGGSVTLQVPVRRPI